MGKGDIKTKKGKRFASSYGRLRLRKTKNTPFTVKPITVKKEQEKSVEVKEEAVEKKEKSTSKAKKKSSKKK